jgi:hypothetical protein
MVVFLLDLTVEVGLLIILETIGSKVKQHKVVKKFGVLLNQLMDFLFG